MAISKIGSNAITDGAITADDLASGAVESAMTTQIGGRRNLIINGAMQVAQRGTSFASADDVYTLDRWYYGLSDSGTWTITQDTDVPSAQGFNASWKADCTATGTANQQRLIYKIEGYDTNQLAYGASGAKTATLSFWVKSNKTGSAALSVEVYGGTSNRYYNTAYTISSANTWEYKTITISGDTASGLNTDNSLSYLISWWFSAGSSLVNSQTSLDDWTTDATYATIANGQSFELCDNTANYVNITGVQLEVGSVATPFEHRSYGEELALCQRYYYNHTPKGLDGSTKSSVMNAAAYQTSSVFGVLHFPVSMRTSPTLDFDNTVDNLYRIFHNGTNTNCRASEFAIQRSDVNSIALAAQGLSGFTVGHAAWIETNAASGNVGMCSFDAEL